MPISQDEARESLAQIEEASRRARKMIAYAGTDVIFMLWGAIWIAGYLCTHVAPGAAGWAWLILVAGGIAGTLVVSVRSSPVKGPLGIRIGFFWFLLFLYVDFWILLLWPFIKVNGQEEGELLAKHFGAIAATVPMFAYVIMGLWLDHFMLWIGIAVTLLTAAGLFLFPAWFWLWMAITGGGTLLGTGLFIRNRWR